MCCLTEDFICFQATAKGAFVWFGNESAAIIDFCFKATLTVLLTYFNKQ